jgi:hypothetical protein
MHTVLDRAGCGNTGGAHAEGWFAVNPYLALQYHFGMLLGVDDLETEQGYHRGKHRLHQAWLHGKGVVWGLDVSFNPDRALAVYPGTAVDGMGRDLHLDTPVCMDLGKWYAENQDQAEYEFEDVEDGGKRFTAHVVARFDACLTRPVPAVADPCGPDEANGTSYSRVYETIALELRPGPAPEPARPYRRLRILFRLEPDAPEYQEVADRRGDILALPAEQQAAAYLDAFREFAALDTIDLRPRRGPGGERDSLYPEEPSEVVLADLTDVVVHPTGGGENAAWRLADPLPTIDTRVRPAHVATSTIQELLCGPLFGAGPAEPGEPEPEPGEPGEPEPEPASDDAPRVIRESVNVADPRLVLFEVDHPLERKSVEPPQFSVSSFTTADGWRDLSIRAATLDGTGTKINLVLGDAMTDGLTRIIAHGTGPRPLLGRSPGLLPLAGATGDPPAPPYDGRDFVHMVRR